MVDGHMVDARDAALEEGATGISAGTMVTAPTPASSPPAVLSLSVLGQPSPLQAAPPEVGVVGGVAVAKFEKKVELGCFAYR